VLAFHWCSMSH